VDETDRRFRDHTGACAVFPAADHCYDRDYGHDHFGDYGHDHFGDYGIPTPSVRGLIEK